MKGRLHRQEIHRQYFGSKRRCRYHSYHNRRYIYYRTNRWFAERNGVNNAWNFNGNNRNLNNNNVNNAFQVGAVANLLGEYNMQTKTIEERMFASQMVITFDTERNKRRGHDSLVYENHIISNNVKATRRRLERSLRIEQNYAFLTSLPRWREIMATEFEGRKIDHEVCDTVIPKADEILSPYTFNNRKGKGSQAAINCLIEHINEVTCNYTKPARIIKHDFKGYFPNALWTYAEKCICEVIDQTDREDKDYLKWLTMIAIHCNPAAHCELRTPSYMWKEHIEPEKSILTKPENVGAAIGRLIWQTAMGLYINDIIEWLTVDCGLHLVCFVDDIVMIVPEERHEYALSLLPELRRRLAERNVRLNDKKFYDQPYEHGVEFLGTHIKPYRIHLNNRTYGRAVERIKMLNVAKYKDIDAMVQSFNSYSGMLKNRTDYNRLMALKDMITPEWWQWLDWDSRRFCLVYKPEYSVNERLNRKYCLNLKRKNYDTIRNHRAEKCSEQREVNITVAA